jgi:hypothetical protein
VKHASLALVLLCAGAACADEPTPKTAPETRPETGPAELAQWGRGPLEVRDPYLLALSRLSPWARSPEVLGHGQVEVGLRGMWANSYGFEPGRFVVDGEVRQVIAAVRFGLLDRIELGLDLPYEWRGGGALDGFIEGFHDAFGIPDMSRSDRPKDRYLVAGVESDGTPYGHEHDGYGFADLIATGRVLVTKGSRVLPAVTASIRLRLPTGRPKFQLSDGVDVSLGVDASKRLGDLPLFVSGHVFYTYHAQGRVDGLELYRHRVYVGMGFEWQLVPRVSLVAHVWLETKRERQAFEDRPPIPDADLAFGDEVATYYAIGFKFEPVDGLTIEVGMLEDIIDPETTADFGLLGNISYRF